MYYQLKTGHALTAEYLKWTRNQISDECWFCQSGAVQTREHLFKNYRSWKMQQADLWVEVWMKTGKPKRVGYGKTLYRCETQ